MKPETKTEPNVKQAVSDPDGYELMFESYTDAPEETEFSGDEG